MSTDKNCPSITLPLSFLRNGESARILNDILYNEIPLKDGSVLRTLNGQITTKGFRVLEGKGHPSVLVYVYDKPPALLKKIMAICAPAATYNDKHESVFIFNSHEFVAAFKKITRI